MMRMGLTPEQIAAMTEMEAEGPRDYSSAENVAYADRTSRQNLIDALTRFSSMAASDKAEMAKKQFKYNRNGIAMNDNGEFHVRGDNKYTYRYDGKDYYANGHKIDISKVNPAWEGFTLMKGNEKELPSHGAPNTHKQHVENTGLSMISKPDYGHFFDPRNTNYQGTDDEWERNAIGEGAYNYIKSHAEASGILGGIEGLATGGWRALAGLGAKALPEEAALTGKVGSYAADAAAAAARAPRIAQGVERGMPQFTDEATQFAQRYLGGGARKALSAASRIPRASADLFEDPHIAKVIQAKMSEIASQGTNLPPQKLLQAALSSLGL